MNISSIMRYVKLYIQKTSTNKTQYLVMYRRFACSAKKGANLYINVFLGVMFVISVITGALYLSEWEQKIDEKDMYIQIQNQTIYQQKQRIRELEKKVCR